MRKFVFLMLFFLIFDAKSQESRIQYDFPSKADSLLWTVMNNELGYYSFNPDSMEYFIRLYVSDTTYKLTLSTYCSKCNIYDVDGEIYRWVDFLAINTNRYTNVLGKEIPVVLHEDFFFGIKKLLNEGSGARRASVIIDGPEFNIIIDKRGFNDNVIYKVGFW